jgi:hypothetical protein
MPVHDSSSKTDPDTRYAGLWDSPMTRPEFVQRLILNSMCDDFENLDQVILRDVAGVAAKCGLTVELPEVVENLRMLVEAGLAKAYDLSATTDNPFSGELQGMPPLDTPEDYFRTYFYPTQNGMELHESDETWWPLDANDVLRSDWEPSRS